MAASITFTATAPTGETFTRTSPSMPYTHVMMTRGPGQLMGQKEPGNWGPYSWHKSAAAAHKAANSSHMQQWETTVVEAVPTAVKGTAHVGDFPAANGWQEDAINALITAKNTAPKAKKGKQVKSNVTVYETAADALADLPETPADPEPEADEVPVVDAVLPTSIAKGLAFLSRETNVPTDAERQACIDRELAAIAAQKQAKADAEAVRMNASGRKATHRQLLGEAVHTLIYTALDNERLTLPEGMDADLAREVIGKWLQYIPTPENPAGLPTPRA